MSVDINWDTLTGGPDGQELAEIIKDFVHDRFQQISLPNLIRSVKVHAFDFGTVAPDIVLKDVCNPLPDFYETEGEGDIDGDGNVAARSNQNQNVDPISRPARNANNVQRSQELGRIDQAGSPSLTRGAILGGTSNVGYFGLHAFSGAATPLAAVAGAQQFHNGVQQSEARKQNRVESHGLQSPSSTASPSSRPISRDNSSFDARMASALLEGQASRQAEHPTTEPSPEDLQVVFHATYSGDVRLSMTAEVFLDYPMPSFVGIPLKLNITGMTFNGVGILAYIRKRAHLCFLSPEDAEALVGSDGAAASPGGVETPAEPSRVGALLEEIKIESEMGETGEGKQVLKNVGKIEKFILEQVQRIFEEEFVYPSFWTFLV